MNQKTKIYFIAGGLTISLLMALLGVNFLANQAKSIKKSVVPLGGIDQEQVEDINTRTITAKRTLNSTTKNIISSSSKTNSSNSANSSNSSASSVSSSSTISSSSPSINPEIEARLQWKSDCNNLVGYQDFGQVPEITYISTGLKLIITHCLEGPYQKSSLVYIYEESQGGKWTSTRQTFYPGLTFINGNPKFENGVLKNINKSRAVGDCGVNEKYRFDPQSKSLLSQEIKSQECSELSSNPSVRLDQYGEILSVNPELWPLIL